MGRGNNRREREREEKGGERSSNFPLDLATIELSAFVRVRDEVCPHDEGFA